MESAITTGPVISSRRDVLAEVMYTHSEEDFVALWMYSWDQAHNQRFHPLAHRLVGWTRLTVLRASAIAFLLVVAFAITGEKSTNYILGATAVTFCWALVVSLTKLFLVGPKGLFNKLARWRYRRKMRRTARQMAARKTEINLSRHHSLLLTVDSCIHLVELDEIDQSSTLTERIETATSWTAFERIEMTDQHAFLFERRWTIILPRRGFLNDAAFRQFIDLARRLHQAAIHGYAPSFQWRQTDERITD
jgi:hypothetical protein